MALKTLQDSPDAFLGELKDRGRSSGGIRDEER